MNQTTPSKLPTILWPEELVTAADLAALCAVLRQAIAPTNAHYKAPKGHSETQFELDLWQYFPQRIHTGLLMPRPGQAQPYVPDFAYIDPSLNLHIDIEVDEPYTHDTRQPLHYLGAEKDDRRNQFFLDAGWVVIRFSEQQVVKSPMSCCKAIASTIAAITADNTLMTPFRQVPTLKPSPRWSYEEAQVMATQASRSQYLAALEPPPAAKRKSRKPAVAPRPRAIATATRTVYCPACGEGPFPWKGHYIACPNCHYDQFGA